MGDAAPEGMVEGSVTARAGAARAPAQELLFCRERPAAADGPPPTRLSPSMPESGEATMRSRHSELWRLVFTLAAFVAVWGLVGALLLAGD